MGAVSRREWVEFWRSGLAGVVIFALLTLYAFLFARSDWLGGPIIDLPFGMSGFFFMVLSVGTPIGAIVALVVQTVRSGRSVPWGGIVSIIIGTMIGIPLSIGIAIYCFAC